MLKDIISEINLVYQHELFPIEVFFLEKYHNDYYPRGQILELWDKVYSDNDNSQYFHVNYYVMITALIKSDYFKERNASEFIRYDDYYSPRFGVLLGCSEDELFGILRDWVKKKSASSKNSIESMDYETRYYLNRRNKSLQIEKANIIDSRYLTKSIKDGKEIILYNVDIVYKDIINGEEKLPSYNKRIYTLLSRHFSTSSTFSDEDMIDVFYGLFDDLKYNLNFNIMAKTEYISLLETIGNFAYEWIKEKNVSNRYIELLENFISKYRYVREGGIMPATIDNREEIISNPIMGFCFKFFDDLIDNLVDHKKIKLCQSCGNLIKDKRREKFCSESCSKSYHAHKYYLNLKKIKTISYPPKKGSKE